MDSPLGVPDKQQGPGMHRLQLENLTRALEIFPGHEPFSENLAGILLSACEKDTITHDGLNQGKLQDFSDVLLFLWEWKFILPVRSAKCGEWDSRLLTAGPDEIFEMPHISRALVRQAARTGAWESRSAILDLFSLMGEPEALKMPDLVLEMRKGCVHYTLTGARIGAACVKTGLKDKTGAMIAVLKGSGIISPKLMAFSGKSRASSPLYEFNPCVYAEWEGV